MLVVWDYRVFSGAILVYSGSFCKFHYASLCLSIGAYINMIFG